MLPPAVVLRDARGGACGAMLADMRHVAHGRTVLDDVELARSWPWTMVHCRLALGGVVVLTTIDLGVRYRLRTANERVVVRTGVAGHMGSARSLALVCSSARR